MTPIDVFIVDAFAETPLLGNPAGVVLDARGLSEATMRRIAFEVGFSDSAFVLPGGEGADHHLRFFSPHREVELSGHCIVATYWLLATEGRIAVPDGASRFVARTSAGLFPVTVEATAGRVRRVMMEQSRPTFERPRLNVDKLAALLGVGRTMIADDLPVEIVSTGLRTLHVPLAGLNACAELKPLLRGLADLAARHDVRLVQVFAREARQPGVHVHCRVFAPTLGIDEDPVTGTSAGSLGAYLTRHRAAPPPEAGITFIVVEQGEEIGRPGTVEVEVEGEGDAIRCVRAGGRAVLALRGKLEIAP